MFDWVRNPWFWVPASCTLAVGIVVGLIGFFTERWLLAVIAALAILLIVFLVLLVRMVVTRERGDRLDRGLEGDLEDARAQAATSAAGADVKSRFREALLEIRRSLGGRGGVYEVPWYLVIGATGSGKSTLLGECGLDLPAQYARSRMFGPTQTCDFFLFNEAIGLDTAGRYFSSDADEDRAEWQLLLDQLRSSRADCPANGILFTIPAATLLTLGPDQLEEQARQLRRRLNEIQVHLGVDAPVYLLVTKADQIEGFTEFANALPPERHAEAFGWTNDQRRMADAGERIQMAFGELRARLDGLLPDLLMRSPDPVAKRRMFVFPEEVEELGRAVARFARSAFKRDIYNAIPPFLRGVYLTSACATGDAVSPTLHRLGQTWARTQHGAGGPAPRYLRELFLEVMIGDEELALPESRLGPIARRVILGAGGLVALGVLVLWAFSFVQNYSGTHDLERTARLALSTDPSIQDLTALRESVEYNQGEVSTWVNRLGFRTLAGAVYDAKRTFVASFERNFDRYTRENVEQALRQRDDNVFRAAVAAATDLEYIATSAASIAPDLSPYVPRRMKDPKGYAEAYRRFIEWMRPPDRDQLREAQRDVLATRAAALLDIGKLEEQTRGAEGSFPPVTYVEAGLDAPDSSSRGMVPGLYTHLGYDGLFKRLLASVENTGAVPVARVNEVRRRYVDRFDRSWRRYLLDVPTGPRSDPAVRKSPHLKILEQIGTQSGDDLQRDAAPPAWIGMVAEVRRTEVQGEEEKVAPYTEYLAALDAVAIDVEDGQAEPEQALALAREVAGGKGSSFEDALAVVKRIVPRKGDASVRGKLRDILEAPILDGYSALLDSARRELDRRWAERIVSRYGGRLSEQDLLALYDPSTGELDVFVQEELGPFYAAGGAKRMVGDRTMSFGPSFLGWMKRAEGMQRSIAGGSQIAVRLRGVPATVEGSPGMRVKRRDLRLVCPSEQQTFTYREGSGSKTFRWTTSCQSLSLRITVGDDSGQERELRREWTGPLALPTFLQQGQRLGGGVMQWTVDDSSGLRVKAKYRIESGDEIARIVHRPPPGSLGS
ncbi:MAG: hypothetical protein JRG76_10260 [Deltaproteobacteria bacterium]|nr:hypothetical protein [Deltaproteobacteria bacterium]MBW2414879.1 hypothetical protein [Deltaproteobacteria bacterium]